MGVYSSREWCNVATGMVSRNQRFLSLDHYFLPSNGCLKYLYISSPLIIIPYSVGNYSVCMEGTKFLSSCTVRCAITLLIHKSRLAVLYPLMQTVDETSNMKPVQNKAWSAICCYKQACWEVAGYRLVSFSCSVANLFQCIIIPVQDASHLTWDGDAVIHLHVNWECILLIY